MSADYSSVLVRAVGEILGTRSVGTALAAQAVPPMGNRPAWTPAVPVVGKSGDENWVVHGNAFHSAFIRPLKAGMRSRACRMRLSVRTRLLRGGIAARRPGRLRQVAVVQFVSAIGAC